MLIGYVSDENYAALAGVSIELKSEGVWTVVTSWPSGAVHAEVPPGTYEVCLAKPGFGSKRVTLNVSGTEPIHFRLLSDRLLGYAWPKWCRVGEPVEFRVHSVEPYKLGLWRYGWKREFVRNLGWFDNHGPRAVSQVLPDSHFVETGVHWDNGHGVHRQFINAPERTGLYYFHAKGESGAFFSFPLVVAPSKPTATIAVLASTNTWNAYNPFGGRSNYIMASKIIDTPVVNSKADLPRYKSTDYGEWRSGPTFAPLSFDRPEPINAVPETDEVTSPIEGRQPCHVAPAEWRLLGWLEHEGYDYDLFSDYQLHDGTLNLDNYRVLVINTHPEYWSADAFRAVQKWVFERGGKLMYLGGNGLNCEIQFTNNGATMECINAWPKDKESRMHASVAPEASLLGVVYTDPGAMTAAPYEVLDPNHWIFEGTKLRKGELFGQKTLHERCGDGASGHETDKISPSSPSGLRALARGLNPDNGGAEIVHIETPSGGEVFSVGSITFPSALLVDKRCSKITKNVLRRFLRR